MSPASLTRLAVRSASEPVQLPDALAGAADLDRGRAPLDLYVPPLMATGRVAVVTGRGRDVGRAVDGLEAVEDVELSGIGHDRVVAGAAAGQVGRAVADVDLVVAVVRETTSRPPPGLIVSLPDPPRNVCDELPPVSVSLPAPPSRSPRRGRPRRP